MHRLWVFDSFLGVFIVCDELCEIRLLAYCNNLENLSNALRAESDKHSNA